MPGRRAFIRAVLTGTGAALTAGIAGCLGNESLGETQEELDQMGENLDAAGQKFQELQQALENEEWESCLASVDPVREDLTAAEENATEAQQLAEEGGHDQRAEVATIGLDLIDILGQMVDEVEAICTAAQNEDFETVNERLETLEGLNQQRQQKTQELGDAIEELEE